MTSTPTAPAAGPTLTGMPVTFDQARQIVHDYVSETWPPSYGTLTVAPWGWEDDTHWRIVYGAAEAATDDDYVLMDAPVLLVDKQTGAVERVVLIAALERLDAMRPVGDNHPQGVPG